ncbi:hypothetical protein Bbelb_015980 [Branchiostoma belcheri]|nr:hypothetical protein Bbelb_015980 [Branchiostoma belcheri]
MATSLGRTEGLVQKRLRFSVQKRLRFSYSSLDLCPEGLPAVQVFLSCSDHSCLNLTRLDWTRPGDLKTQDEYQRRLDQTGPGHYEDPRRISEKIGPDQTWTFEDRRRISDADPETGLQQEEEPDICRQGCVKEDGEE